MNPPTFKQHAHIQILFIFLMMLISLFKFRNAQRIGTNDDISSTISSKGYIYWVIMASWLVFF